MGPGYDYTKYGRAGYPAPARVCRVWSGCLKIFNVAKMLETVIRSETWESGTYKASEILQIQRFISSSTVPCKSSKHYFPFENPTTTILFLNQVIPLRRKQNSANNTQRPPIWSSTWVLFLLLPWLPPRLLLLLVRPREWESPLAVSIQHPWKLNLAVLTILHSAQEWAVDGSHAGFISLKQEAGMNRWRWEFAGATCDDFKKSLEVLEGGGNNYNCSDEEDKPFFEVNQVVGPAGDKSMVTAVKRVTRQPCCDLGLPDWGMDRCLQDSNDEDADKKCN